MNEKDYLYDLLVHDLTGPLSVVAGTVTRLLGRADLKESEREPLQRVLRNTKKAQLLVREILQVARAEECLFNRDEFDVRELVGECVVNVVERLDPRGAEKLQGVRDSEAVWGVLEGEGISLRITGRYKSSPLLQDRGKIGQIIENLLSNGLKFRRKRIGISVSGERDIVISVEDDGPGIPRQDRDRVFKRFMQLDNLDAGAAKGLGLGLFCVKALVETMGGEILIDSGKEGGTKFTVRIPPFNEPFEEVL